jgi:hypothetical protein
MSFSFRVKINQHEIEICGTREEVLKTIEDLPSLVANVSKAFEHVKATSGETAATPISVRVTAGGPQTPLSASKGVSSIPFPSLGSVKNCSEAVLKLLESDWGKWRPRTLPEIVEALKANAVHYPSTTLSGVLKWLVRKKKVRRWKTDAGYVYILVEKEGD